VQETDLEASTCCNKCTSNLTFILPLRNFQCGHSVVTFFTATSTLLTHPKLRVIFPREQQGQQQTFPHFRRVNATPEVLTCGMAALLQQRKCAGRSKSHVDECSREIYTQSRIEGGNVVDLRGNTALRGRGGKKGETPTTRKGSVLYCWAMSGLRLYCSFS
jgi:hypothetical protein